MSLDSVLVDTAHGEFMGQSGPRKNGVTPKGLQTTAQFNCRASKPTTSELNADQVRFTQFQRDITLLTGPTYADGITPLVIDETWRILIESGPFAGEYEQLGGPEVIRKRDIDDIVGYTLSLRHYSRQGS